MGLFGGQFSNVVEWQEFSDDVLFWKWDNDEIKRGSKLIIRQGQDAIFMYNGKVEGIFTDEGSFDIESDIIPFLSSLKGFKFGFNSGIRAEVLFINTKEITVKWGTKSAINIPAAGLPGGMPIRAFGTFNCKVCDYDVLIEKVAGIKKMFTVDDVKERVLSFLNQLLMKWIVREGKDMFNLSANAYDIAKGIGMDMDMEMRRIGIAITGFVISNVSYPESVQEMINKAASQSMVQDVGRYQQMNMAESFLRPGSGGSMAADMAGMQMGMMMGQHLAAQMNQTKGTQANGQPGGYMNQNTNGGMGSPAGAAPAFGGPNASGGPNFCPNCGTKVSGARFCPNCGLKL